MNGQRLVVVRPEPGNAATAARARRLGWTVDPMPLFAVAPVAWTPPDPAGFDALLLTSANAVRHGGVDLALFKGLPVLAVGRATAAAAAAAGFRVVLTGTDDAEVLAKAAAARGFARPLHLAGLDRRDTGATAVTVYDSHALPPASDAAVRLAGAVVLLHSPRAARAVAGLVADRRRTAIAALGSSVADTAGLGWRAVAVAGSRDDEALLAAAATLSD